MNISIKRLVAVPSPEHVIGVSFYIAWCQWPGGTGPFAVMIVDKPHTLIFRSEDEARTWAQRKGLVCASVTEVKGEHLSVVEDTMAAQGLALAMVTGYSVRGFSTHSDGRLN